MTKKLYKMMNWPEIEGIIYSECDKPHDLLGPHIIKNKIVIPTKIIYTNVDDTPTVKSTFQACDAIWSSALSYCFPAFART